MIRKISLLILLIFAGLCPVSAKRFLHSFNFMSYKNVPVLAPVCTPDDPVLFASQTTVCSGSGTTLTVTGGNLNSATDWFWYSNTCGGTFVGQGTSIVVNPLTSTDYFARGEGGCVMGNCGTISIIVNPLPTPFPGLPQTICAYDTVYLGATGASNHNYSWSSNPSGFFASTDSTYDTPAVSTVYYVTDLYFTTNCVGTDSVMITVNPLPFPSAGADLTVCSGDSITIGGAAIANHTYSWTSIPAGFTSTISNPFVQPSFFTFYYLEETNPLTGCVQNDDMNVLPNPSPLALTGSSQGFCIGDSVQLGNSPLSGHTYSWTSNPAGFISSVYDCYVSPSDTTMYYLTETIDANGCQKSDSVIIYANASPLATTGSDTTICGGNPVYIGAPSVSGNIYSWSSNPSGFLNGIGDATVVPAVTTTYYLTETILSSSCMRSDSVTITVNSTVAANVGSDQTICYGGGANIGDFPNAGHTYSWTSNPPGYTSTAALPYVTPLTTTTYYLTEVITAGGCSGTDSVVVFVNANPPADAGHDTTVCAGMPVNLGNNTVGGLFYSWTSAPGGFSSAQDNPVATPNISTSYFLEVYDITFTCTGYDTVNVTVNPIPLVDAGSDHSICVGASANIGSGFTSGHSYLWTSAPAGLSSTASSLNVSPIVNTGYYLTETINSTGCQAIDSTHVIMTVSSPANTGPNSVICFGDSAEIGISSISGHTYSWSSSPFGYSSAASTAMVSPSVTTNYNLNETVTSSGCILTGTVSVTVNPLPSADTGPDQTICSGASVTIGSANVSGHSYSWSSNPPGFSSLQSQAGVSPTITTTYYLTETNSATSCTASDSVTITVDVASTIDAGSNTTICNGTSIGLNASGGTNYFWSPSASLDNASSSNPVASPVLTTLYTLTINSACGNLSDTVRVTVNALPAAFVVNDTSFCNSASLSLGAAPVGSNLYNWSPPADLSDAFASNPLLTTTTSNTYHLTETDLTTGCSNSDSVVVIVFHPVVDAGTDLTICSGTNAVLAASGGTVYSWSPTLGLSNVNIPNPVASPSGTITYTVTVQNLCGIYTDTVTTTVNPSPVAFAGSSSNLCDYDNLQLGNSGAADVLYFWSPTSGLSDSHVPDPIAHPSVSTTYSLTAIDAINLCSSSDTVRITIIPSTGFSAGSDVTICPGSSVTLNASGGTSYSWIGGPLGTLSSTTIANPVATPLISSTYQVNVSNVCAAQNLSITVSLYSAPPAFTGNDTAICYGNMISIGGPPVGTNIYSWNSSATLSDLSASNPTASPLTTIMYTLTETDGTTGCTNSNDIQVAVAFATVPVTTNSPLCAGSTLTLSSPVGTLHSWNGPAGFHSAQQDTGIASASTSNSGTYNLTMTSASGCVGHGIALVTVNPAYAINHSASICSGDSVFLAGQYRQTPGTFADTLSAMAGCDSIIFTTLSVRPVYSLNSNITICAGDSAFIQGAWRKTSGVYTDHFNTIFSCDSAINRNLIVHNIIPVFIGNDTTISYGESVTLNAGTGYMTYHWSTGASGQTLVADTAGIFWVEVTDNLGCTDVDSMTVNFFVGIESQNTFQAAAVFPNPTTGKYYIEINSFIRDECIFVVTDVLGRETENRKLVLQPGKNLVEGDLSENPSGIYFIKLRGKSGIVSEKIVFERR